MLSSAMRKLNCTTMSGPIAVLGWAGVYQVLLAHWFGWQLTARSRLPLLVSRITPDLTTGHSGLGIPAELRCGARQLSPTLRCRNSLVDSVYLDIGA